MVSQRTGVSPYNRNRFPDTGFMPIYVTDRPSPEQTDIESNLNVTGSSSSRGEVHISTKSTTPE